MTVTVVGRDLHQITFRPARDGGVAEDLTIRDMHPLTGQRLDLWRLKNFDGTRLPPRQARTCSMWWPRRIRPTSA